MYLMGGGKDCQAFPHQLPKVYYTTRKSRLILGETIFY
jgi:hypothetical protein